MFILNLLYSNWKSALLVMLCHGTASTNKQSFDFRKAINCFSLKLCLKKISCECWWQLTVLHKPILFRNSLGQFKYCFCYL